jgi:acetyl-CoA C-acetyltransferase
VGLRELAARALRSAVQQTHVEKPDALYVANMLSPRLSNQTQLGALIADHIGWRGVEAITIEAACASGGAAFQAAVRAIASGMIDVAAVCGVEKMRAASTEKVVSALATAADAETEGVYGTSFAVLNALLMRRYMHEYQIPHRAFAPFSLNAHQNALHNPNAMFHKCLTEEMYNDAPIVADPITRLDSAPICDGAAALILCPVEMAHDLAKKAVVRVLASATATDSVALSDRYDMLGMLAIQTSVSKALQQARLAHEDIDLFELHDAFSIIAALSLEAAGFAERGKATRLAQDGGIAVRGKVPISTMGGLKARGHPVGATGVYELVDVITQLRGEASVNQIPNAEFGMTQNIGGTGSTVITHILARAS